MQIQSKFWLSSVFMAYMTFVIALTYMYMPQNIFCNLAHISHLADLEMRYSIVEIVTDLHIDDTACVY